MARRSQALLVAEGFGGQAAPRGGRLGLRVSVLLGGSTPPERRATVGRYSTSGPGSWPGQREYRLLASEYHGDKVDQVADRLHAGDISVVDKLHLPRFLECDQQLVALQ